MIKKNFCIICFCFLGLSLVFAKEEPLIIRINLIDKSGGSYQWFDIFHLGEVRYYHVQTEFTPTYFPNLNIVYEYRTLHCEGEGNNKCRWTNLGNQHIVLRGISISQELLDETTNTLLDEIDDELLEFGTPSGSKSKKIQVREGNNEVVFLLRLVWTGGNRNGDAQIETTITDITDNVNLF